MVGLLFGPAAGGLVEGGGRRWASLLKAGKRAGLGARGVVVGLLFGPAAGGLVEARRFVLTRAVTRRKLD